MADHRAVAFVPEFALPTRQPPRRHRSVSLSPSSYPGARVPLRRPRTPLRTTATTIPRRTVPSAVFLPPGGLPAIPDDEESLDSDSDTNLDSQLDSDDSLSRPPSPNPSPKPAQELHSIDRLLEETSPDYETWVDRNARRTLTTFRGGSQWTLGADELNESLRPSFLQRHRHVLAPDEAFGAIFTWDVIVANARQLELQAWEAVAAEKKLPVPDMDDIVRAEGMAPEAAVSRVFYWTDDWGEVKRCVFLKHEKFHELERNFRYKTTQGIETWLDMLERYGIPCILCAAAQTKERVRTIVSTLGLSKYFTNNDIVSTEDEFESLEQMLLVAALKCERPPGKCVVFTDKPNGITAGHEVTAKVIAVIGAHPAYEMKTADQLVSDFDDLVLYNIRRLFSEDGMEFMDPQTELEHERM